MLEGIMKNIYDKKNLRNIIVQMVFYDYRTLAHLGRRKLKQSDTG